MSDQEAGPSGVGAGAASADNSAPPKRKRKTQASVKQTIDQLEKEIAELRQLKIQTDNDIKAKTKILKEAKKELADMKKTAQKRKKKSGKPTRKAAQPQPQPTIQPGRVRYLVTEVA